MRGMYRTMQSLEGRGPRDDGETSCGCASLMRIGGRNAAVAGYLSCSWLVARLRELRKSPIYRIFAHYTAAPAHSTKNIQI